MTAEGMDEIDDILNEVLPEKEGSDSVSSTDRDFTIAQTISASERQHVIDDEINRISELLDIPEPTAEMAKSLRDQYREKRGNLQGTALELVATSCLYCAAKVTEVPLDPTDFAEAGQSVATKTSLLRRSKDIAKQVGLDPSAFFGSEQYVDRYCDKLGAGDDVKQRAHEIVRITEEMGLSSGKSPSGWAAAAVYNASLETGKGYTQSELSDIANVTEVTIRTRYQEQREAI